MKVRYIGDYYKVRLYKGKVYDVLSVENGCYKIMDETEDNGFFFPDEFEVVDEADEKT